MRSFIAISLIAVALAGVVVLDQDNFEAVVNGDKHVLVKFYAPWCGHCQRLAPEYERLADAFEKQADVVIAEVDADKERLIGGRFGVTGYPSLKFFKKGESVDEPVDYDDERTAEAMVKWVNKQADTKAFVRPPVQNVMILTSANFHSTINSGKVVFVKFFAPWCGHCKHLAPVFEKLASVYEEDDEVVIAELNCESYSSIAETYQVTGYPTLIIFTQGHHDRYEGARDIQALTEFVNKHVVYARNVDGTLESSVGREAAIDSLLDAGDDYAAIKSEVEAMKEEEVPFKSVYASILNKAVAQGKQYFATEKERMEKFLDNPSIAKARKRLFRVRRNILRAFEKDEHKEEDKEVAEPEDANNEL